MHANPCCCNIKIGYDDSVTISHLQDLGVCSQYSSACISVTALLNIASDVSRLGECKLVYAGFRPGQSVRKAVIFDSADWPAVRSYIESGGRLVLTAENALNVTQDTALTNSFLTAMGSAMQWAGGTYEAPLGTGACLGSLAGTAQIGLGLPVHPIYGFPAIDISNSAAAEVSGGTSVFIGRNSGKVMMAVEQLGNGFLFFNADNNIYGGCCDDATSCTFFDRLYSRADSAII